MDKFYKPRTTLALMFDSLSFLCNDKTCFCTTCIAVQSKKKRQENKTKEKERNTVYDCTSHDSNTLAVARNP